MRVKSTPAPLMMICWSRPASTPVEALRVLKMVAPKYMNTLMPVTCWRMASAMPMHERQPQAAGEQFAPGALFLRERGLDAGELAPGECRPADFFRGSGCASSSRFRSISQRGLSGIGISSSARTAADGAMPVPNIQRQPVSMSHAWFSGRAGSPWAWAMK